MRQQLLHKKTWPVVSVASLAYLLAGLALESRLGADSVPWLSAGGLALLGAWIALLARELDAARAADHAVSTRNTQAVAALYTLLPIRRPLPPMGTHWAIHAAFGERLLDTILDRRPQYIVELGSGASTLVCAYTLEKLGNGGRILSVDHDARFAAITRERVHQHGLASIADVRHVPLAEVDAAGRKQPWYEPSAFADIPPIDLLIVDGPPSKVGREARYPALPVLLARLADNAVVLVDDAKRREERAIVDAWCKQYPEFEAEYIDTPAGTYVLRRRAAAPRTP